LLAENADRLTKHLTDLTCQHLQASCIFTCKTPAKCRPLAHFAGGLSRACPACV